jgi:LysM repeat protein
MITYTVQFGDTIFTIAQRFGINALGIAEVNNIVWPNEIFIGEKLIIPTYETIRSVRFSNNKQQYEWTPIKKIFGQEGSTIGDVFKVTFPRFDLKVSIGDISVEPDLAFTSWVAFEKLEKNSIIMGDLVLLESEIEPVMSSLIKNGIKVTALHNHLLQEIPRIMYMHIRGTGNAIKLAQSIRTALSLTKTSFTEKKLLVSSQIDWEMVEDILGRKGSRKGKVLQLSFPRVTAFKESGMDIPPTMGVSHAINFQWEGLKAVATGDFVLLADEVNPVIRALKENGIAVTAIHNHMLNEVPRIFFLHFWAVEQPERLAKSLKYVIELAK